MLGYAAYATDPWRPKSRVDWATVAVGSALIIALYNALLFVGQQGVTSGVAAILVAMNPILATGFSRLFLPDERLTSLGILGLVLGIAGVGLVARPNPSNLFTSDIVASGMVLLAAVCVALGSVLVQRIESDISTEGVGRVVELSRSDYSSYRKHRAPIRIHECRNCLNGVDRDSTLSRGLRQCDGLFHLFRSARPTWRYRD